MSGSGLNSKVGSRIGILELVSDPNLKVWSQIGSRGQVSGQKIGLELDAEVGS